jgi:hypothetical protein
MTVGPSPIDPARTALLLMDFQPCGPQRRGRRLRARSRLVVSRGPVRWRRRFRAKRAGQHEAGVAVEFAEQAAGGVGLAGARDP